MKKIERQKLILELKEKIQRRLNIPVSIETSPSGRDGTMLCVNIKRKEVKNLEVIAYANGSIHMGVSIANSNKETYKTSSLIKSIMRLEGYELIIDQTNPRYKFDLDIFESAFNFLSEHQALEEVENKRMSTKLFAYKYSPIKIAERYQFAITNKDQPMLDLCRSLLDADKFDKKISINFASIERTYREHLVPCVMIHNHIIEMIQSDKTLTEVAKVISHHLKIAYIKPDEAKTLDYEMKLRTSMPNGWNWGDSIMARLNAAQIELHNLKS